MAFNLPGLSDAVGPNPFATPFPAVNTFTISGLTMPGKWTLLDATKKFGWQIQQGFGMSGASVFPAGDGLITAKFKGEFWNTIDFQVYKEFRSRLFNEAVLAPFGPLVGLGHGIHHPELQALGVTAVVLLETKPAVDMGGGLWTVHHDFLQYRSPVKAKPKPKQTTPDVVVPKPDPQSALEIEAQKLAAVKNARLATLLGK